MKYVKKPIEKSVSNESNDKVLCVVKDLNEVKELDAEINYAVYYYSNPIFESIQSLFVLAIEAIQKMFVEKVPVSEDVDKAAELITPDMNEGQIQRIEERQKQFMQLKNIKGGFLIRNGDEINSILIAALRSLNPDQLIILRDSLIARTPKDTVMNTEIKSAGVWVKASERLPEENGKPYFFKYREHPFIGVFFKERFIASDVNNFGKEDFNKIKWLDEQPVSNISEDIDKAAENIYNPNEESYVQEKFVY